MQLTTQEKAVSTIYRNPILLDYFVKCNFTESGNSAVLVTCGVDIQIPYSLLKNIVHVKDINSQYKNRRGVILGGINIRSLKRLTSRINKMLDEQYSKAFNMLEEYGIDMTQHRKQYRIGVDEQECKGIHKQHKTIAGMMKYLNMLDETRPGYHDLLEDYENAHNKYMQLIHDEFFAVDFPNLASLTPPKPYNQIIEHREKRKMLAQSVTVTAA